MMTAQLWMACWSFRAISAGVYWSSSPVKKRTSGTFIGTVRRVSTSAAGSPTRDVIRPRSASGRLPGSQPENPGSTPGRGTKGP